MSFLLAFAVAFSSATAAPAPARPSTASDSPIVVEGSRDPRRPANEYLDKIIPPSFDAELGRFEDPVCAATIGLPDQLKSEVLARIHAVAAAANIPTAAARCTPNLLIVVIDDKKAMIEGMRREKQSYLYGVGSDRVKALENGAGPVAAWQVSDVIGADGMPLRVDGDGYPRLFTTVAPSRMVNTTRRRVLGGVVIVERRGLMNVTTRQLADFALVRALSPMPVRDGPAPSSSVLSLFNPGTRPEDAPQTVTWWDLAFLKALFDTRSDTLASAQRHEIRDRMLEEMAKVPADQR
jgi:hypothetical protein